MAQKYVNYLRRIREELFPFVDYAINVRRLKQVRDSTDILSREEYVKYPVLTTEGLEERLDQEHRRAATLDEKTVKLTLAFSVGLTVLGLMVGFATKPENSPATHTVFVALIHAGLYYVLIAGFVSLGALRTQPLYGYGTMFLLRRKEDSSSNLLAECLARQEIMNVMRHLRNETAYQSLRNGMVLFFTGLAVLVGISFRGFLCFLLP